MAKIRMSTTGSDSQQDDLSSNELEMIYIGKSDLAYRKKLGQFFTPYSIACFMSQWFTELPINEPRILDPCAGLGVFERAFCSQNPDLVATARFTLWEKDERLALDLFEICKRLDIHYSVTSEDFLDEHVWSVTYDAIIANPPYYKHHYVENKEDIRADIAAKVGAPFSVQTNIYCWFLIKALALLQPGGRLAFIVPTEFLNANYGQKVKKHLLDTGYLRHIISICYKSNLFEGVITTACVLLAEKTEASSNGIRFYRAKSPEELDNLGNFLVNTEFIEFATDDLNIERKWRSYFPGNRVVDTESVNLVPFSTYGKFSRGIATGANKFFVVRPSIVAEHSLPSESLIACLSKAQQAPGKVFTQHDFVALQLADKAIYLFDGEAGTCQDIERYIRLGQKLGYQHRYLAKIRNPWYALEKRLLSKIWVGVFSRSGIRFIWNESNCISLTCFHGFQPSRFGEQYMSFLFLYLSSFTGRSFFELEKREYGDGLEKYEPNDINKSLAPNFTLLEHKNLEQLIELQKAFINTEQGVIEEKMILKEADSIFETLIR